MLEAVRAHSRVLSGIGESLTKASATLAATGDESSAENKTNVLRTIQDVIENCAFDPHRSDAVLQDTARFMDLAGSSTAVAAISTMRASSREVASKPKSTPMQAETLKIFEAGIAQASVTLFNFEEAAGALAAQPKSKTNAPVHPHPVLPTNYLVASYFKDSEQLQDRLRHLYLEVGNSCQKRIARDKALLSSIVS